MSNSTYVIPVWDTITASWEKVGGSKKTFWGALILFLAAMFAFGFIEGMLEDGSVLAVVIQAIANITGYFFQMGLFYIGIKRAANLPIEYKQMFHAFQPQIATKIVLLYILQVIIFLPVVLIIIIAAMASSLFPGVSTILPVILFIVGGILTIYLAIRLLISNAIILDRATGPWEAVKQSFKASQGNAWPLLGLVLMQMIIMLVSVIPFGIGLIWSLPFVLICYGLTYHRLMVNVEPVTTTRTTI